MHGALKIRVAAAMLLLCLAASAAAAEPKPRDFKMWENEISAMEKGDAKEAKPQQGIVFVGSSSIRMWKLKNHFADLPVINRGFGGSQIVDSTHFTPRIVHPYNPQIVVLYAGDNDLASGKSPDEVLADYQAFVKGVRENLPKAKIVYIGIKPSIKRWNLVKKVRETNGLIEEAAKQGENLVFVSVDAPMIGEAGLPRKELFVADGLHMTDAGYDVWAELLKPHLKLERTE